MIFRRSVWWHPSRQLAPCHPRYGRRSPTTESMAYLDNGTFTSTNEIPKTKMADTNGALYRAAVSEKYLRTNETHTMDSKSEGP